MFSTTAKELQPVSASADRLLFTNNVARITGLSCRAVRWNAERGNLRGFREPDAPKLWRFKKEDIRRFMARRRRRWK